jgi:hypothetical protein
MKPSFPIGGYPITVTPMFSSDKPQYINNKLYYCQIARCFVKLRSFWLKVISLDQFNNFNNNYEINASKTHL